MSLDPLWLSLRYAGLATLFAIPPGVLLAYILARRAFPGRDLLDAAASLPLALPPAVLVYYLLTASGRWPVARFSTGSCILKMKNNLNNDIII